MISSILPQQRSAQGGKLVEGVLLGDLRQAGTVLRALEMQRVGVQPAETVLALQELKRQRDRERFQRLQTEAQHTSVVHFPISTVRLNTATETRPVESRKRPGGAMPGALVASIGEEFPSSTVCLAATMERRPVALRKPEGGGALLRAGVGWTGMGFGPGVGGSAGAYAPSAVELATAFPSGAS